MTGISVTRYSLKKYGLIQPQFLNNLIKLNWKKKLKGHIGFRYNLNFSINFQFSGNETDTKQIDGYGRRVESGLARPKHIRRTEVKSPSASALIRVSDTVYLSVFLFICGENRIEPMNATVLLFRRLRRHRGFQQLVLDLVYAVNCINPVAEVAHNTPCNIHFIATKF